MRPSLLARAMALALATGVAASAADYAPEVRTDAPVAWLRFQDAASADGAAAKDEAGAHAGVYRGGVATAPGVPGIGGKAAAFDGRGAHVEIPDHPALALDAVSVELWLKSTQSWDQPFWPASATLVSKATEGNGSGDWTIVGGSHPSVGAGCVVAGVGPKAGADVTLPSPAGVNDGAWHHVVWTRSSAGESRLYVDGVLASSAGDGGGSIRNGRPIQVGADPFLKGKAFEGLLAEVAVYDKPLPAARVEAHARAGGLTPKPKAAPKPVPGVADRPAAAPPDAGTEARAGWVKHPGNPVLGGALGTCFDIAVLKEGDTYRMYFSWRPKKSVALAESRDGATWSEPVIALGPARETGWEDDINRPVVVKRGDGFHMWYTGQAKGKSWIGYATSADGKAWERRSIKPVLSADAPWEKVAVMCPHVIWDAGAHLYKMWYSGGEQYEPDAIGYATSPDGLAWTKHAANPVFAADPKAPWEQHKVTACQVEKRGGRYLMFYVGFLDLHRAQIGIARSKDGIGGWERHPANPVLSPGLNRWDHDACYKPYAIFDGKKWLLWYNGRRASVEQIGLATHEGEDLGFDAAPGGDAATPPPAGAAAPALPPRVPPAALKFEALQSHVESFNRGDRELYPQHIPNAAAYDFLKENVPLFDCPDPEIEKTYYFRWWTYRKHLKQTPDGFVVTEFLPKVSWAGKHNTISCAAGHHLYEGRWIRDPRFLDDYAAFWFLKGGDPRRYSFWAADAIWARSLAIGDTALASKLLPDLVRNGEAWEKDRLDASGLFWQVDDRDGMEVSIGGSGCRATINSYQYGDALAIAAIAERAGQGDLAASYREKAARIKRLVQEKLWDPEAQFFKVLPRGDGKTLADVRELHGYTPWYFNLPGPDKAVAWKQLMDPKGFFAPFGPTTAEQRHPKFALAYQGHECQWNGPSWPYATSVTLTALAHLLNGPPQDAIGRKEYLEMLRIYALSHRLKREDGTVVPWIDENLNPLTGDWISRTRLKGWKNGTWDAGKGGEERGKDYNHSTFCDLVITGLAGLRPRADDTVEVNPLVPEGAWDWFCLDRVPYHGRTLTILYDKTGERYKKGKGLRVLADGKEIASSERLGRVTGPLPRN